VQPGSNTPRLDAVDPHVGDPRMAEVYNRAGP